MATSDRDSHPTSGAHGEWHRWQMEELGYPPASEPSATHADARRRRQRQDAEAKARRSIAEKARLEGLEQGYREGHEQGYQAGYSGGVKEGNAAAELEFNKRLDMSLAPLAGLADNFRLALASLDAEIADQLVELALIAGRQLAGESLAAKPEHILSVVRELLDADTTLNGKPRLWLNPQDLELVKSTMSDTLEASGWECHADPTLERGGCRATSAGGGLDASLSTQWKAILDQRRRSRTGSASTESTLVKGNSDDGEAPGE
ncbi:flagellar assembly protein FliH [Salinicola acroporae]|uniref:Flagellar assembly protein FliH n=1 Tax=Salinicola acroporae TaxID=1541440 RepID=A0ABT6I5Z2_9GAMM|nr:flagellar assembly protein FliH [Salinicola acroporae]MDH4573112.1 flagellar assembly protein FliH [Salinicola acroporae]